MGRVILMENHRLPCSVAGCESVAYTRSSGLCVMHYARMKKHGSTADPRPARFGEKKDHPLWMRWTLLKRRRALCPEWMDFWTFADGVSPQPANTKKLVRPDENAPYSPHNFAWAKTPTPEDVVAYQREYRLKYPHKRRAHHLATKYDLTIGEYDRIFAEQDGRCAICGSRDSHPDNQRRGLKRRLAVDHDHETNEVRGLLCGDCNIGLGHFKDNPTTILRAIGYLRQHARQRLRVVK